VGTPSDATIHIVTDSNGSPSASQLTSGTLNASAVTGTYGWVDVALSPNPALVQGTTYWLVLDTGSTNSTRYYTWAKHDNSGYGNGVGKYCSNYSSCTWSDANGDFGFKTFMGGVVTKLKTITVTKTGSNSVHANTIEGSVIGSGSGNGVQTDCKVFDDGTVSGNINCGSIEDATIAGNVTTETLTNSTVSGNLTCESWDGEPPSVVTGAENCPTPVTPPADPPPQDMPISDGNVNQWKADAQLGGTIPGDYAITSNTNLGPKEITGNLGFSANGLTLTVTGTLFVHGSITAPQDTQIKCAASYGDTSCIIVTDGYIEVSNGADFSGSGTAGSYIMMLSTSSCNGVVQTGCAASAQYSAIYLKNGVIGAIFYASNGRIYLAQTVALTEATGFRLYLENNANVTYQTGLQSTKFASGPGAAWVYKKGTYQVL
jgi:hypothetical protein